MNTATDNEFNQRIMELTTQYYSDNKKNTFFKNNQKIDCANTITQNIGLNELISKTIYIIPSTNAVFLDYTLFKTYATPDNYPRIVEYILSLFQLCIQHYGNYSAHVNLDTFTISAAERYKSVVNLFLKSCMMSNSDYSLRLTNMYIYYTPNTFQNISGLLSPFIDPLVKEKIILYDKKESQKKLQQLLVLV